MNQLLLPTEVAFLSEAAGYLEKPSFAIRVASLVGKPLEFITRLAPDRAHQLVHAALEKSMAVAVATIPGQNDVAVLPHEPPTSRSWTEVMHQIAVAVSGGVGGTFGLPALAIELPISTTIMFRSIAAVAQRAGEDLRDPATRLDCLTVFSHGGPSVDDDAMESSYLTSRFGMSEVIQQSARLVAGASAAEISEMLSKGAAPALVQLIARVAARFNITVSQKLVAQSVPVVGAVGGAAVNVAFLDHFNTVARYHFGIRVLERKRVVELVQAAYKTEQLRLRAAK